MLLNVSMRLLLLACGLALLACGCNKTGESSHSGKQANVQPQAPAVAETEEAGETIAEAPPVPTMDQVLALVMNQTLVLAPEYGLTVNPQLDLLEQVKNPEVKETLSAMTERVAQVILDSNEPVTDTLVAGYTRRELEILANKAPAGSPAEEANTGEALGPPVDEVNLDEYKRLPVETAPELLVPEKIIGVWSSVAEIKDSTVVNHDSEYYDAIDFRDRTNGFYTMIRDGQVSSHREFTYNFDPENGRLLLRFEDEGVWTILLQQPVNNPAELRLKKISEGQTTVFRLN